MITCHLRYEIDPRQVAAFEEYVTGWIPIVNGLGGTHHGCFLPHEGPDDTACALFSFPSPAAYESYRAALRSDPRARELRQLSERTGCVRRVDRTFLRPVTGATGAGDAAPPRSGERCADGGHGALPVSAEVTIRTARPTDYDGIVTVIDGWWGRPVTGLLNRLHLNHFHDTSLIAEGGNGELAGFVIGFLSPSRSDEAYIHFTGIAPDKRRTGLARTLYERFFANARQEGRTLVKAVTSPENTRSIAFHTAMGFDCSDPMADYDGPGQDRVVFSRRL